MLCLYWYGIVNFPKPSRHTQKLPRSVYPFPVKFLRKYVMLVQAKIRKKEGKLTFLDVTSRIHVGKTWTELTVKLVICGSEIAPKFIPDSELFLFPFLLEPDPWVVRPMSRQTKNWMRDVVKLSLRLQWRTGIPEREFWPRELPYLVMCMCTQFRSSIEKTPVYVLLASVRLRESTDTV